MCFVISVILLILTYNFYLAHNTLLAVGSLVLSMFFIFLMIKNIRYIKNLKNELKAKKDDN